MRPNMICSPQLAAFLAIFLFHFCFMKTSSQLDQFSGRTENWRGPPDLDSAEQVVHGPCGISEPTAFEGVVASPDRDEWRTLFSTKLDCYYRFRTGYSSKLVLKLFEFRIDSMMPECQHDYLEIFVGCHEMSIGRFCTSDHIHRLHNVYSPDHCMKLHFHWSGRWNQIGAKWQGFRGLYSSFVDLGLGTSDGVPPRITNSTQGAMISAGWPNHYTPGVTQEWLVMAPSRCGIKLSVMDVNFGHTPAGSVACLQISAVESRGKMKRLQDICSSSSPFYVIYRQYSRLLLNFSSDYHMKNNTGRGIVVGYLSFCGTAVHEQEKGKVAPPSSFDKDTMVVVAPSCTVILLVLLAVSVKVMCYKHRQPRDPITVANSQLDLEGIPNEETCWTENNTETTEPCLDRQDLGCERKDSSEIASQTAHWPTNASLPTQTELAPIAEEMHTSEHSSKFCFMVSVETNESISTKIQKFLSQALPSCPVSLGDLPWEMKDSDHHEGNQNVTFTCVPSNCDNDRITYSVICEQSDCSTKRTPCQCASDGNKIDFSDNTPEFGSAGQLKTVSPALDLVSSLDSTSTSGGEYQQAFEYRGNVVKVPEGQTIATEKNSAVDSENKPLEFHAVKSDSPKMSRIYKYLRSDIGVETVPLVCIKENQPTTNTVNGGAHLIVSYQRRQSTV